MTQQQTFFQHVILEGDAYKIGRIQGEAIRGIPGFVNFLGSGAGRFSPEQFAELSAKMEKFCPGIGEEIRGMAEAIGIPQQDLIYYSFTHLHKGKCSHFAVLPSRTEEKRPLIGRSYEFTPKTEDLRLCTMRVDGKYAFIGSSLLFFGFTEGMNEHGLVVTMSAGGWPVGATPEMRPPLDDGFQFWFVVRCALERCKTVDEAVALIMEIPTCGNPNIIVADRSGNAALVEVFGRNKAVKRIDAQSEEQFVCSTNHFTLPAMEPFRDPVWVNSQVRYDAIRACLDGEQKVTRQSIKSLLSSEYPQGLACHYYDEGFGTLRSMIFDPVAAEIEMCFGSPVGGEWKRIDFNTRMGSHPMRLEFKKMPDDFMKPVQ